MKHTLHNRDHKHILAMSEGWDKDFSGRRDGSGFLPGIQEGRMTSSAPLYESENLFFCYLVFSVFINLDLRIQEARLIACLFQSEISHLGPYACHAVDYYLFVLRHLR